MLQCQCTIELNIAITILKHQYYRDDPTDNIHNLNHLNTR